MYQKISALLSVLLAVSSVACSKSENPVPARTETAATVTPPAPALTPPPAPATTNVGTGTIIGKVSFEGTAPKMAPQLRQSDPVCAKEQMNSNFVVVAADGGLKDTMVRLPVRSAKGAVPTGPVVIDQKSCIYTPHVVGVVLGQTFQVKNSDGTTHNIHSYLGEESGFNEVQPPGAAPLDKPIEAEAGEVLKLKCDVHAWMESHLVVSDHPFFQVTGDDGSFKLEDVPQGTYQLEAWHPHLGDKPKTVTVTVEPGKTVEAKFTFGTVDYTP